MKTSHESLIEQTRSHIEKIYPWARDVSITVDEDGHGVFNAKIIVTSNRGDLIAKKHDSNFQKSLDKSYHAIVRQIHKIKAKNDRRKHPDHHHYYEEDEDLSA
ncbi:MAG: HPF/RaiA family ribosome-associated protein [Halobacteriovoraceae bacterium]|nr:HPF/RaiA family ribosome-associated protein [Halobacteriovoraceae bacterium]MCB9093877.1 HPF/RaiA family ribosome-associated protein [Halobacteriovoraceae bacterium]